MIRGIVRLFLLLVLLTIIVSSTSADPSTGLITINLSMSTDIKILSDIISINQFVIPNSSHHTELNSNTPDETKTITSPHTTDQEVFWSRTMKGITHTYQAVIAPGTTWNQARDAAIAKKGHLATITSKAENDIVFSHIQNTSYWSGCIGNMFGPWLGGFQPAGSHNSSTGWYWVTGEKWEYTNWDPEEPNDFLGGEDKLFFYVNTCTPSSTWGDHRDDGDGVTAYIIEWEKPVISPLMVFSPTNHLEYAEKVPKYSLSDNVALQRF